MEIEMTIHYAYAQGRCVYDQNDRLLAAFANAELASIFAMKVVAGEILVERRAVQ